MPTPLTYAVDEVEQVRSLVNDYIERTGVTVTSIATDAQLPRAFLYRFLSGSYEHSPKYEDICRLLSAVGYRLVPQIKK